MDPMMCMYTLDEGKGKGVGAFPECGPLAEDSAKKLKTKCVYCDRQFPPVAGNNDVCGK
jgi:hypothetical protein